MEYRIWHNENGPDIGCCPSRGVIEQDGLFFRNLEGTGELLPYEDWRLTPEERAKDLADRLTVEEIAGLMLYSPHQRVPAPSDGPFPGFYGGKGYAESGAAPYELTEAEQHLLLLENGVDQFGGNYDIAPILEAYRMGCGKYGEEAMLARMRRSAARLLTNSFRCGLFENPYLDPEESCRITGCREFVEAGYRAQLGSVVLLKNKKVLPLTAPITKVYIPVRQITPGITFFRTPGGEPYELDPMQGAALPEGFVRVDTPEEADAAVVFLESPKSECYDRNRDEPGGNGYFPISLQYRPYQAEKARKVSIAGGDFREESDNRSYQGKSAVIYNEADLDNVVRTKEQMGNKPVIAVIRMHNPAVLSELEPFADAILCEFGVQKRAVFDLISGKEERPDDHLPYGHRRHRPSAGTDCISIPSEVLCEGHHRWRGEGIKL